MIKKCDCENEVNSQKLAVTINYGCLFAAKLNWKENFFFWKNMFITKEFCYWKKLFFTEKNINENVKYIYIIWEIYFYTENVSVTNRI